VSDTMIISSYPPEWSELVKRTAKTHAAYAKHHGYEYALDCSSFQDRVWPQGHMIGIRGFIKLDLMLHYLPRYEYVMWIDADAMFTNYDIPIEQFRSPGVTMGFDQNGFHSTVFIAHSTDLVYDYFWAANNIGRRRFLADDFHEMEALKWMGTWPPYSSLFKFYSVKELCPILADEYVEAGQPLKVSGKYKWEKGDWTLHFSALPLQRRIERATEYGEMLGLL